MNFEPEGIFRGAVAVFVATLVNHFRFLIWSVLAPEVIQEQKVSFEA